MLVCFQVAAAQRSYCLKAPTGHIRAVKRRMQLYGRAFGWDCQVVWFIVH